MRAATAILLMAIATAACSGGGPIGSATPGTSPLPGTSATPAAQPPAGQALDACALLTEEDIEQVTGREVESATPGSMMGIFTNGCSWELALGDADMTPVSIDLGVLSPQGVEYYETYIKPYDTTPISGIGDDAVADGAGEITAVKGDTLLSVFVIAFGEDEEAFTRDLTLAALARVP